MGRMPTHLTDVAFLEWVRHRTTKFAPESQTQVEVHLEGCAACRAKLAEFDALERSMHAFGHPFQKPRVLAAWRALKVIAIVALVAALCWVGARAFS